MKKETILKKAIEKAVDNQDTFDFSLVTGAGKRKYYEIIFSHSFAKAFWGKRVHEWERDHVNCDFCDENDSNRTNYCWQYHLQQMVLEKDPIKYLERFIDEKEEAR